MSTKTDVSPIADTDAKSSIGDGFPFAHIINKVLFPPPVKPGDIALCGAVLQGIDLDGKVVRKVCPRCQELALELIQW